MTGLPHDPMVRLGQLAQWATLGTTLARLMREAERTNLPDDERAEIAEAIAASVGQLADVSLDQITDAVAALSPLLDVEGRYALVETLTVEQAAAALGVVPRTVRAAITAGHLPTERATGERGGGRDHRIRPADLREYRERRRPPGRPRKGAE